MGAPSAVCATSRKQLTIFPLNVFSLSTCGAALEIFLDGRIPQKLVLIFFAGLAWAIWNKMVIEKKFPSNPDMVIYAAVNFRQMWGELLKEADKSKIVMMASQAGSWMAKKEHYPVITDIVVL